MISLTINGWEAPGLLEDAIVFIVFALVIRGAFALAHDVVSWRRK